MIKRTFTFSMTLYLSMVCAVIYLLFEEWYSYLLTHNVSILSFKEGMFSQCNGTKITSDEIKTKLINVRNYTTYGTYLESDNKRLFPLLVSTILLVFHLFDSLINCSKVSTNFLAFFAGYKVKDCEQSMENIPEMIPLDTLQDEIEERLQQRQNDILYQRKPTNGSQNRIWQRLGVYVLSFVGLSMIILLACIPQLFYLSNIETNSSGKQFDTINLFSSNLLTFYTYNTVGCVTDYSWQCKSESGHDCQFPFMVDGEYSYQCKEIGGDVKPKCALGSVIINEKKIGDSSNYHPCGPTCPGGKIGSF